MTVPRHLLACLLALTIPFLAAVSRPAGAASFEIAPVILDLSAARATDSVRIVNCDERAISIQVRCYDWTQVDGEDQLEPTGAVLLSPPLFTLAPGASQTVRLLVRTPTGDTEAAYRLLIDQIPAPDDKAAISFKFRVSIPVFMAPAAKADPRLSWEIVGGSAPYVAVRNAGNRRVKLASLSVALPDGERILPAMGAHPYVLAGRSRRFTFTAPGSVKALTPVALTAVSEAGSETLILNSRDP